METWNFNNTAQDIPKRLCKLFRSNWFITELQFVENTLKSQGDTPWRVIALCWHQIHSLQFTHNFTWQTSTSYFHNLRNCLVQLMLQLAATIWNVSRFTYNNNKVAVNHVYCAPKKLSRFYFMMTLAVWIRSWKQSRRDQDGRRTSKRCN